MKALFQDILERSKLNPDALFKQLSSLAIGPLVIGEIGMNLADRPLLHELSTGFSELRYSAGADAEPIG